MPVKKGKSITGKYYKDIVLKKLKKYYQKRRPTTGLNMSVFYTTMLLHIPPQKLRLFKERKSNCFASPPYSSHLAPCNFYLFPKLKSFLARRKYQSKHVLVSAMHQYLITVTKTAYRDALKKWIHRLKFCISSHREYFEGME